MNIDINALFNLFKYNPKEPLLFNTGLFLFVFLAFLIVYIALKRKDRFRIIYVIAFSAYFYYKSSGNYVVALFAVIAWDYCLAQEINDAKDKFNKRLFLSLSILANIGLLCYFKYTNFFYSIYMDIVDKPFSPFNIILPAGISFFTFQSMSYTIDIYRGKLKPLTSLFDYAFYVSFFPPLVAGPIVRAKDFIPQIRRPLFVSRIMFGEGLFLILIGLVKKTIISDYISVNFVDRIFDNPNLYTGIENLFGVYGYAMQIYCDFSGYSDMAIGVALLLGFRFKDNFNSPYQSATITEFWRRWHISLSSWLKDYLYISLGGNRKGKIRTYINLIVTMLLGGLWHGASLRFIAWGALHGISLAIHKLLLSLYPELKPSGKGMKPVWKVLSTIFTFHLVALGWIFFRAETFEIGIDVLVRIFTQFQPQLFFDIINDYKIVLLLILFGFVLHYTPKSWENKCKAVFISFPLSLKITVLLAVIIVVTQVKSSEIMSFIYYNF